MMLAGEGAAIVVDQGIYRVVPSAEAVAGAPLRGGGSRRVPGVGAHVIPLRYVAAAEMERIIKSIAPQGTILRVDAARNLLVVAGTGSDLDGIMDAVSVFDVDWMRGMSFGLFPIETGDPEAIAQELDTVFANDQDSPSKGMVRFVPNRRLKAVLVITLARRIPEEGRDLAAPHRHGGQGHREAGARLPHPAPARPASSPSCCRRSTASRSSRAARACARPVLTIINSPETVPRPTNFQVVPGVPAGTTRSAAADGRR